MTNGYATASLVLGILWLWWLGSVLALVFGHTARNQIIASGGRQTGEGLAIAGIVLGWIGIVTFVRASADSSTRVAEITSVWRRGPG